MTVITSPYLDGRPAKFMARHQCAYCARPLTDIPSNRFRTRDHILPRSVGRVDLGVENIRPACGQCNQLRATLGHCTGALMLAIIEARYRHIDRREAVVVLRMLPTARERLADRRAKRVLRSSQRAEARFMRQSGVAP